MTEPVWNGRGRDPWLPQRLEARLEIATIERQVRAAVWAALSDWLVQTARRVLRGTTEVPAPDAIWARVPAWREAVELILNGEILKALGVAFERILGPGSGWEGREFTTNYLAEVRNRMVRIPDEVFDLVAGQISQGVNLGDSIPELAMRVDNVLSTTKSERWRNRAVVVARTEAIGAMNAGRLEAFKIVAEDEDGPMEKLWLATEDSRTRETHQEADGQRVALASPFSVGLAQLQFPGDPSGPPQEVIQCVIESTKVAWPRQALYGSTRRRHYGPLVQLITAEGHDLTVTPNHPVLTPTGYIPAGLLSKGQDVLATPEPPSPEVHNAPFCVEEIHSALSQAGESERVMGSRMDFHGDGSPDDEVEIVSANGDLTRYVNPRGFSERLKTGFVRLEDRTRPLSGLSNSVVTLTPVPGGPDDMFTGRLVGLSGEGAPVGGGETGEAQAVRFASAPDLQVEGDQVPDDGRTAESDFPAHLQYALASGMAVTKIVDVNRLSGNHWVYNLSTSDHWFTGNGIALHNCRCTMLLVEPGEDVDLSNRQMRRNR
jgi:hypothetical protein